MSFETSFKNLLQIEGGYVDDPSDSGGKTRFGITEAVARENGYTGSMNRLPLETAGEIYRKRYWDALKLDQVDDHEITHELFDSAVNVGVRLPAKWLQRSLNALNLNERRWEDVAIDGQVGEVTIRELKTCLSKNKWRDRLLKLLNVIQGNHYLEITEKREKDERFLGGWLDQRVKIH